MQHEAPGKKILSCTHLYWDEKELRSVSVLQSSEGMCRLSLELEEGRAVKVGDKEMVLEGWLSRWRRLSPSLETWDDPWDLRWRDCWRLSSDPHLHVAMAVCTHPPARAPMGIGKINRKYSDQFKQLRSKLWTEMNKTKVVFRKKI